MFYWGGGDVGVLRKRMWSKTCRTILDLLSPCAEQQAEGEGSVGGEVSLRPCKKEPEFDIVSRWSESTGGQIVRQLWG